MIDLKLSFPSDYFIEEERCGHPVTTKAKEIWAVELDLYAEFQRVCEKNNIQYFACGGTMLGAVRHGGFIPWDDDMDLMMFRDQYDKLCSIASTEFKHPYFFQTEYSDPGSLRQHAQLRNSLTTGILNKEKDKKYRFNQGIFIDIFPIDAVIDDTEKQNAQKKEAFRYLTISKKMANLSVRYIESQNPVKRIVKSFVHFVFGNYCKSHYQDYFKKYEATISMYNSSHSSSKYIVTPLVKYNPRWYRLREDFKEIIYLDFEFLKMPVPKNYDNNLRRLYGDYHQFVKGGSMHGGVFFDTDKSYIEYIER
ncbi:MAG: LicD family protein [Bacteroidaceae bacterium]|nr:LicD family protein [Bacteroidaceae bacterium]